jgi:hypothetical protein
MMSTEHIYRILPRPPIESYCMHIYWSLRYFGRRVNLRPASIRRAPRPARGPIFYYGGLYELVWGIHINILTKYNTKLVT